MLYYTYTDNNTIYDFTLITLVGGKGIFLFKILYNYITIWYTVYNRSREIPTKYKKSKEIIKMRNYTGMKIAKKYEDKIELIEKDMDGVWAYTEKGYKFESSDCHTERQDNQKELYKAIRTVVPCDCKQCQAEEVEEVEEVKAEQPEELEEATATVRSAGKKFKYTVTVNGREENRLSVKDNYSHIVLIRRHDSDAARRNNKSIGKWVVFSYHKNYELAMKQAESHKFNPASKYIQMPADTVIIPVTK